MNDEAMQVATQNAMMMLALSVVGFLMQLGFLAVALTVVRKVNRTASALLASASGISLFLVIAHPLASIALPFLIGTDSSAAQMLSANGAISTLFGMVQVGAGMLQLVGIVKLAQGMRGESVRGDSARPE